MGSFHRAGVMRVPHPPGPRETALGSKAAAPTAASRADLPCALWSLLGWASHPLRAHSNVTTNSNGCSVSPHHMQSSERHCFWLSPMRPILIPARASALRADCAPGPGVLVLLPPVARSLMCTAPMPSSCGPAHQEAFKGVLITTECAEAKQEALSLIRTSHLAAHSHILCCEHSSIR